LKDIKVGFSAVALPGSARRLVRVEKIGKERQPFAAALASHRLMAMAGVWES